MEDAEKYMEPTNQFFLFIVHKDVLVVERKYYEVHEPGVKQPFGKHKKYEAAYKDKGHPICCTGCS
nr:hypothetical protein [Cytophaga sp. FL35]